MQIFADVFNFRHAVTPLMVVQVWGQRSIRGRSGAIPGLRNGCRQNGSRKDIFMPVESNAKRYDAMNKGFSKT